MDNFFLLPLPIINNTYQGQLSSVNWNTKQIKFSEYLIVVEIKNVNFLVW